MIKKLFSAFLLMFFALAIGAVTGADLLGVQACAADTMPDGADDPDGNDNGSTGNGGPDDTYDDGGCGGGGYDDGGFADPDGSGSYDGI